MKTLQSISVLVFLAVSAGFCFPQADAPTAQPVPPQSESTPAQPQDQAPPPATPQIQEPPQSATASSAKPTAKRHKPRRTKGPSVPATAHLGKVVVRNGGARENSPQLSPAMTKEQELHNRASTAQLLATAQSNLQAIEGHQLTSSQQDMVSQIRSYMQQAKAASDSGDLTRAHTLAFKAHLLSDDLVRR